MSEFALRPATLVDHGARDSTPLDPAKDAARIRAFFVHPTYARQGVGRAILDRCESEASRVGFRSFELMATLPGVPFYEACGYARGEPTQFEIADGVKIEFVPMTKIRKP